MQHRRVALLVTGCANDSQLKALFNYLLRSGDAVRFHEFLEAAVERVPEQKEKIMTIADRLREEGHWEGVKVGVQQGMQQGVRQEALRIAQTMLENGMDIAMVQLITGLSADDLVSLHR